MVSADNMNLDCLELIFAYLSGNDLVSVSLVSRSFLVAAIPRLYRTLTFTLKQAKRYPSIMSPFASVLAHQDLATHVRHIDIRAVSTVKFLLRPKFFDECTRTIALCQNLGSFTCTVDVVPSFLLALQEKRSLESVRFMANLTTDQAAQAAKITGLRSLTLDSASWTVVDVLPKWSVTLQPSLTSLTLTHVQTLSPEIMESTLPNFPHLDSLHVISCPKVDQSTILRLVSYTPNLQSLAFTSYDSMRSVPPIVTPLPRLRHLAIETQCAPTPGNATPAFWSTMINFTRLWSCPIKSLSLKLSDNIALSPPFVDNLTFSHRETLTHLSLRNVVLSDGCIAKICRECRELETLRLSLPAKDMPMFTNAVSRAKRLHTIADIGDVHGHHNQRAIIPKSDIRTLMERQPTLEKVITDGRTWTAVRFPGRKNFELQIKKNATSLRHWFMPPAGVVEPS